MHELRFVKEIFTILKQKAGEDNLWAEILVKARLSPFSHVTAESLIESFKELIKGENFKNNVRLEIKPLEILLQCKDCKRSTQIIKRIFVCPFCKSVNVNMQIEREFFVDSIEIEQKEKKEGEEKWELT